MRKIIRSIPSIQRIMDEVSCDSVVAMDIQEDKIAMAINNVSRNGWELDSVSGSPEQGLVLVFKSVD